MLLIEKILPLLILIAIGYLLRVRKVLDFEKSRLLLNIVFYVTLPATLFSSMVKVNLSKEMIMLPISGALVLISFFIIGKIVFNQMNIPENKKKIMLLGIMMANTAYLGLPLMGALYGEEGIVKTGIFDIGAAVIAYTLVYWIVSSSKGEGILKNASKVLFVPGIWAVIIGLIVSSNSIQLGTPIMNTIAYLGAGTTPLVMIATGGLLQFKIKEKKLAGIIAAMKIVFGLIIGFSIVSLFGFTGATRDIVLICSILPCAMLTIIYASIAKIETEFAVELVTVSTIVSLIGISILVSFL